MNLALAGVIILLLVSPGILFRRLYYTAEFSKQFFKSSFVEQIYPSMAASLVLHGVMLPFTCITDYRIDLATLGLLISGTNNAERLEMALQNVQANITPILIYHTIILLVSGSSGYFIKSLVRYYGLDRRYRFLRFKNEWHYYVSGEYLDFEGIPDESEEIDFTYVDALVDTKDGAIIYSGVLTDYVLSNEHGLDRIYLSEVRRRCLSPDLPTPIVNVDQENILNEIDGSSTENTSTLVSPWYPVKGQIMAIPFENIINLNFTYYQIED